MLRRCEFASERIFDRGRTPSGRKPCGTVKHVMARKREISTFFKQSGNMFANYIFANCFQDRRLLFMICFRVHFKNKFWVIFKADFMEYLGVDYSPMNVRFYTSDGFTVGLAPFRHIEKIHVWNPNTDYSYDVSPERLYKDYLEGGELSHV